VIEREVEDHGNAVAALPFDPHRRTALMVRVLRAPALVSAGRAALLECPAGIIEEADTAHTARREAYEEVGCNCGIWSTPGGSAPRPESPRR
jgi:8-oxo-dGTP pyrophosphatase MutT (NUDIX family)